MTQDRDYNWMYYISCYKKYVHYLAQKVAFVGTNGAALPNLTKNSKDDL